MGQGSIPTSPTGGGSTTPTARPSCPALGGTQEWNDGILSNIARVAVRGEGSGRCWITFDGPVDALWIENMNTVCPNVVPRVLFHREGGWRIFCFSLF